MSLGDAKPGAGEPFGTVTVLEWVENLHKQTLTLNSELARIQPEAPPGTHRTASAAMRPLYKGKMA